MVGRVGEDMLAEHVLASLKSSGVNTQFVRKDRSVSTGACCIHVDAAGDNTIIIVPEGNLACSPEDVDAATDVIRSADMLVCQLEIAIPAVVQAVELAASLDVPVILNPAPAGPVPAGLFAKAAVLTPNETEAEYYSGIPLPAASASEPGSLDWEAAASRRLREMGAPTVVVTLGHRGAYFATGQANEWVPGYAVEAVDTTAAGDAFNGALAVALAEGRNLAQAVSFANAAGALAATCAGAQPSLPSRSTLEEFLRTRTQSASPRAIEHTRGEPDR